MDMNNCMSACSDIQHVCIDRGVEKDTEWLVSHLPTLEYTKNRILNYMFSNGMSSGGNAENERLEQWLYEGMNLTGATNYSVLSDAIGQALIYGECGLRMYNGNLYTYHQGHYGVLYRITEGVEEVVAYYIRKDGEKVDPDLKTDEWSSFESYDDITNWFDGKQLILLDPSEFVNLRNDTTYMHGKSPFAVDKLRVDLLLSVYERLNYDILYDGPGRIIVRPKTGYTEDENNETSTSKILDQNEQKQYKDMLGEVRRVSNEIKNSSSDSVIALSNGFSDKIEHLPRVTKATEFFGWIDNEAVIVAQLLGMSPVLMETGKWSGNVSMSAIIDNAMLNTIVPMREKYAIQFSKMIADEIGVAKVYFNKYDLKQIEDENEARVRLATAIKDLSYAAKSEPNKAIDDVITKLVGVLETSVYDDYGNFRTL